jgi:hypothetical protein
MHISHETTVAAVCLLLGMVGHASALTTKGWRRHVLGQGHASTLTVSLGDRMGAHTGIRATAAPVGRRGRVACRDGAVGAWLVVERLRDSIGSVRRGVLLHR